MVASEQHLYQTIVLPRKLATGSIYDYLFCTAPLVGIQFEVLRITEGCNIVLLSSSGVYHPKEVHKLLQ